MTLSGPVPSAGPLPPRGHRRGLWPRFLPLIVVLAGIGAYWTSFRGVFVFDDFTFVRDPSIRSLWPIEEVLKATRRPTVNLTLAINYTAGALNPWGYHAMNLAIHLLGGLTLFGIVHRCLSQGPFRSGFAKGTRSLAMAVSLIWVVHPLQTQSVTYTIQRAESLMGLFYLLTTYCVLRGAHSGRSPLWYGGAVLSCALGMGSKAVMVTAPVVVLIFDWVCIAPSIRILISRRWGLYAGLAATWLLIWYTARAVFDPGRSNASVGLSVPGVTPIDYALTQPGVILHYLKLALWPAALCLDYGWEIAHGAADMVPQMAILLLLLLGTAWGLLRKSWIGFVGSWFFLILSPTSSFIPIKDPAFEHRMYLPLAAVVVLVVFGGRAVLQRLLIHGTGTGLRYRLVSAMVLAAVAAPLAYATSERNRLYHSRLTMWHDVVAKRPRNARAHSELGRALDEEAGNLAKAVEEYRVSLRLDGNPLSRFNLANALKKNGQPDEAIDEYRLVLRQRPQYPQAHNNLGTALFERKRFDEAAEHFREALKQEPGSARATYNLGNALLWGGRLEEAVEQYREVLRIDPGYAKAFNNLGLALVKLGRFDQAVISYREALRIDPNRVSTYVNLGIALEKQERWVEASEEYGRALQLNPDLVSGHYRLGKALAMQGHFVEAIASFEETLRLDPNHEPARRRLKEARAKLAGFD